MASATNRIDDNQGGVIAKCKVVESDGRGSVNEGWDGGEHATGVLAKRGTIIIIRSVDKI